MTSAATAESMGFSAHRFLRAHRFVQAWTSGNGSRATHDTPPWYGAAPSAVPWKLISGTGRRSVHQLNGKSWAAPTVPTAAMRSDSVQDSANAIPPPLDNPLAKIIVESMLYAASSVSIS